ncbi:hypothetical protein CNEO4_530090 [Clostridium neonatale]|nr:hypothetical protein CNEO4_530090 [Clostridium neonatale]
MYIGKCDVRDYGSYNYKYNCIR